MCIGSYTIALTSFTANTGTLSITNHCNYRKMVQFSLELCIFVWKDKQFGGGGGGEKGVPHRAAPQTWH